MKKFYKILLVIVLLLLVAYKLYSNSKAVDTPGLYDFEKGDIQERIVDDKKIISEENLGVEVQIPKDWEYEKYYDGIEFKDPDIDVEFVLRDYRDWSKGCFIDFSVSSKGSDKEYSEYDAELNELTLFKTDSNHFCHTDICEVVNINGMDGLKMVHKFDGENFTTPLESILFEIFDLKNKRVYKIESLISSQVPECEEYFNNFLNDLEIKK